jgi:hypothetical protein
MNARRLRRAVWLSAGTKRADVPELSSDRRLNTTTPGPGIRLTDQPTVGEPSGTRRCGTPWLQFQASMNKAFVREPEDTGQRYCPRCGSLGMAVGGETLEAQLVPQARRLISETAWFCPFAQCAVAYFDSLERFVTTDHLLRGVWPKDREAPLCACFGLTREDIEADVAEGGVQRTKEVVTKAKSALADCRRRAASGRSCIAEVQRYYMKLRNSQ